jgi:hypothetical protein
MINQETLIQTLIERTVYNALRVAFVEEGYTPEWDDYVSRQAFEAALTAIKNGPHGFAVEIFGASTSQDKGNKQVPRVVIVPGKSVPGEVGLEFTPIYEATKDVDGNIVDWKKIRHTYQTGHFQFDIHLITNTTKQHRILHHLFNKALGPRKYLSLYNEPETRIFIEQTGYYDQPDTYEGITENVYMYEAKDLYLADGVTIATIQKILNIQLEITPTGRARFLSNGTIEEGFGTQYIHIKLDPMATTIIERFHTHTGPEGPITGPIANLTSALFVSIERGSQPIQPFEGPDPVPANKYRINSDNTITVGGNYIKPNEVFKIIMQLS